MSRSCNIGVLLCALVLRLLWALPASADYKSDYAQGMRAVDKKDWSTVAASMRAAISQNPTASSKKMKLYGNRYTPYMPYFHLGLALYSLGDCPGALDAWQQAEIQGVIQSDSDYQDLLGYRDECRAQAPPPTAPPPTAPPPTAAPTRIPATPTPSGPDPEQLLAEAKARAASLISAGGAAEQELLSRRESSDFAPVWNSSPHLLTRLQQASETLEQARRLSSSTDLDDVESAVSLAEQAQQSFASLATAVDTQQQQLARAAAAARAQLVDEINGLVPAAREALATGETVSRAGQRSLRSDRSLLGGLVESASRAGDGSWSLAELETLRDDLNRTTSTYRDSVNQVLAEESRPVPPTPTPVPTPTALPTPVIDAPRPSVDPLQRLRAATGAFLGGDYADALGALEEVVGEDRVAAVSHLVRAACSFSLYAAGGEEVQALRSAAEADVRRCRAVDSEVIPDEVFFSPDFVSFFNQVGS